MVFPYCRVVKASGMKITIAGAGIGGLTAALALDRAGHQVAVMERAARLEALGAGIVLAANAVRILQKLGVDVEGHGHRLRSGTIVTGSGEKIQTLDFEKFLEGVGQVLSFHRGQLHAALLGALPKHVTLQLGCPYEGGSPFGEDVLVGADGINSAVRRQTVGEIPLQYGGVTCWRTVLPNPGVSEMFEAWGGDARIGVVPLTQERIYVFLVLTSPAGLPRQTSIGAIRRHFERFADPVPAVLDAARDAVLLHHDLEELPGPVWGRGRTVLIGDAAHAMTPNQGQGAAMAIEDAAVLPEVVGSEVPAEALREIRHERVAKVQADSRRLGQVAHWKAGPAVWLRNGLLRRLPLSVSEKHYLNLIGPGLEIAGRTT
jgi:2-polyprenyl-6-methoxyphenol hydroxylase-like FAD-dependent oxidoreductase